MNLPSFPKVDLFSAGVNALNGVPVARDPSHKRGYRLAGLPIMAFFGGIGGGVWRDILCNDIPSPLKDPKYIFVCILMGLLGLALYRYGRVERGTVPEKNSAESAKNGSGSACDVMLIEYSEDSCHRC